MQKLLAVPLAMIRSSVVPCGIVFLTVSSWLLGYVPLLVGGAMLIAGARTIVEKPVVDTAEVEGLRKQVNALRGTVRRYQEELAHVDQINEELRNGK